MKMKKILALVLVLVMALSLMACGEKSDGKDDDSNASTTPATSNNDNENTGNDDANTPNNDGDNGGNTVSASSVGYVTDDVDHSARDTYKFVYCFTASSALTDSMMNAWAKMKDQYNFTVEEVTGEGDSEAYVQNLEVVADCGDVDGFFIDCNPVIANRVIELLDEFKIPFVCMFNPMVNDDGAAIAPALALDQYQSGYDAVQYYCDNYKEYWGDIGNAKVGLLNLDWSTSEPLHDRCVGATDAFLKTFPDGKVVDGDGVTVGNINSECGYDLASQLMSSNSDVEYWIVIGCVEDYTQGCARYIETTTFEDKCLLTTVGSTLLPTEWDSGYEGAWHSCYAIADMSYAGPAACGLIALVDGRATVETLWADRRADGDLATIWIADSMIMTHDNYAGFMQSVDAQYVTK